MKALRLFLILLIWFVVLGMSGIPATNDSLRSLIENSVWLSRGTFIQLTILVVSVVLILVFSKGDLGRYGFKKASKMDIKAALVFGSIIAASLHIILALSRLVLPYSRSNSAFEGSSFVHVVLSTWILASVSEEVLHRGLVQSFLDPLRERGVTVFGARLSLPVLVSAFLFGIMHIMLLTVGFNGYLVGAIVCSAMVLGVIAGYYREKSSSLIPAIIVHMLFNVYGSAADYIRQIIMK